MGRSEQRTVLNAFARVLGKELHHVGERPGTLWQQMYNRLQWADDSERGGPVSQGSGGDREGCYGKGKLAPIGFVTGGV